MSALVKLSTIQIGDSPTLSQNFTLSLPDIPDGTLVLSRGIPGQLIQTILVVETDGTVTFTQGVNP